MFHVGNFCPSNIHWPCLNNLLSILGVCLSPVSPICLNLDTSAPSCLQTRFPNFHFMRSSANCLPGPGSCQHQSLHQAKTKEATRLTRIHGFTDLVMILNAALNEENNVLSLWKSILETFCSCVGCRLHNCRVRACSKCLLQIDCGPNRFLIDSNRETKRLNW